MKFLTALVATYAAVAAAAAIGQPPATNDVAIDAPFVELVPRGKAWDAVKATFGVRSQRKVFEDGLAQSQALPNNHPQKQYRVGYFEQGLALIRARKEVAKMPQGADRQERTRQLLRLQNQFDSNYPEAEVAARFRG